MQRSGHSLSGETAERDFEVLRAVEIFRGVDPDAVRALADQASIRTYRRGERIADGEREGNSITIMVAGRARLFRISSDGQEVLLREYRAGDIAGLALLAAGVMRKSTLEATVDGTRLYRVEREVFHAFLARHSDAAVLALDLLCRRVAELSDRVEGFALHDVKARLMHELAHLAELDDEHTVRETHEVLASRIGTVREVVSREIGKASKRGLIECPMRGIIVVPDPRQLLATSDELG